MLTDQRRNEISAYIYRNGKASVTELAEIFEVSGETIRRDLAAIEKKRNNIKKVHGGAVLKQMPMREDSYEQRLYKNTDIKRRLGEYAASLIGNGEIIAVDAGTDTECFADSIRGVEGIKIITNSLNIAKRLTSKIRGGDFTGSVILLGGNVDIENNCACDELTNTMLSQFSVDKAFIASTAVSTNGIMSWKMSHGLYTRRLIDRADKVYLISDSDKIGNDSFFNIAPIYDIDMIITDNKNSIDCTFRSFCEKSGCEIKIIDCMGDKK